MASIQLKLAFYWDCTCGERNYVQGVPHDMGDEELAELAEMGVDPGDPGNWDLMAAPQYVTCQHCDREFDALPPDGGEDLDDDLDGDTNADWPPDVDFDDIGDYDDEK